MRCEHRIVISVSQVKVTYIEGWDQSQMWSNCVYPLREVFHDERVLEITWDIFTTNHTNQRRDVVGQDRRHLLCIRQIIAVLSSFLGRCSTRLSCSRGGCF
jgi:hypothetical protein